MSVDTWQHGIARYMEGCKCDICMWASRERSRRSRRRRRKERQPQPGDVQCLYCRCWFHPRGIGPHQWRCDG